MVLLGDLGMKTGKISKNKRTELSTDFRDFECEKCISVSEWTNGEGVDISISHSHRSDTFSLTWNEYDAMVALCSLAHLDYDDSKEE